MNIYDAIFIRKSVRNYIMEEIDGKIITNLLKFIKYITLLEDQFNVSFKIIENIHGENKTIAGISVKAPYYLAISSEEIDNHLLNVGFVMQQISLYLTAKGLGTCFVGISKSKLDKAVIMDYPIVLLLAFGNAKENVYRDFRKAKRIREEDLCTFKTEVTKDIKALLKAARLAPSSVNNQPWRFVVYENRIHVFCSKDRRLIKLFPCYKEIDIGIMLANMLLAAEELWLEVSMKKQDNIAEKNFKKNEYIISVLIK